MQNVTPTAPAPDAPAPTAPAPTAPAPTAPALTVPAPPVPPPAVSEPADETYRSVIRALAEVLRRDLSDVGPQTRLFEDLNLDSTSVLELLMAIEEELGVEFDADDLEQSHFATVESLTRYVRNAGA